MKADTTEKGLESLIMRPNHEAPDELDTEDTEELAGVDA